MTTKTQGHRIAIVRDRAEDMKRLADNAEARGDEDAAYIHRAAQHAAERLIHVKVALGYVPCDCECRMSDTGRIEHIECAPCTAARFATVSP